MIMLTDKIFLHPIDHFFNRRKEDNFFYEKSKFEENKENFSKEFMYNYPFHAFNGQCNNDDTENYLYSDINIYEKKMNFEFLNNFEEENILKDSFDSGIIYEDDKKNYSFKEKNLSIIKNSFSLKNIFIYFNYNDLINEIKIFKEKKIDMLKYFILLATITNNSLSNTNSNNKISDNENKNISNENDKYCNDINNNVIKHLPFEVENSSTLFDSLFTKTSKNIDSYKNINQNISSQVINNSNLNFIESENNSITQVKRNECENIHKLNISPNKYNLNNAKSKKNFVSIFSFINENNCKLFSQINKSNENEIKFTNKQEYELGIINNKINCSTKENLMLTNIHKIELNNLSFIKKQNENFIENSIFNLIKEEKLLLNKNFNFALKNSLKENRKNVNCSIIHNSADIKLKVKLSKFIRSEISIQDFIRANTIENYFCNNKEKIFGIFNNKEKISENKPEKIINDTIHDYKSFNFFLFENNHNEIPIKESKLNRNNEEILNLKIKVKINSFFISENLTKEKIYGYEKSSKIINDPFIFQ